MYHQHDGVRTASARLLPLGLAALLGCIGLLPTSSAWGQTIIKKLESPNERIELYVNSSRILTLDQNIPRVQVNNPDILAVTPLSKDQVQISAKKPGVTDVNLWGEDNQIYTVNVVVYGDVQELQLALNTQYPGSAIQVHRYSNSLVLSGFVDRPDNVSSIVRLAEDYAPKVINNISVGGVQQILLNVQVMEVSRTKLRALGFDFANINGNDFVVSSVSGLISAVSPNSGVVSGAAGDTVRFGIVDGQNGFFGFLRALRQYDMMKILAEPKLVTVSGRPASFNSGGEFPVLVPQSLGTVSIEYKKFGTQVDFMPLVLGNGNIRLEVRPRVSEIDNTRSVVVQNFTIPGLRVREVDTAVEMKAGQTLALAGLIQNRQESQNRGLPVLADIPYLGAAFRSVNHTNNEIELLILVRPEFVDGLEPHEVPAGGPGLSTDAPCDGDLYWKGFLESPPGECTTNKCPPGQPCDCQPVQHTEHLPGPLMETGPMPPAAPTNNNAVRRPITIGKTAGSVRKPAPTVAPTQPTNPTSPRNASNPNVQTSRGAPPKTAGAPGMIGPVGYDVLK